MAGGKIRGQIVFWVCFLLIIVILFLGAGILLNPTYESISSVLSHFNIHITQIDLDIPSTIWVNLLIIFVAALIETMIVFAVFGGLGAFIGMLLNAVFPAFTTYRIDKIFAELIPLLERVKEANPNNETEEMLNDATKLNLRWQKSWANKIARFATSKQNRQKFDKVKLK
jgi:hypothetical protein